MKIYPEDNPQLIFLLVTTLVKMFVNWNHHPKRSSLVNKKPFWTVKIPVNIPMDQESSIKTTIHYWNPHLHPGFTMRRIVITEVFTSRWGFYIQSLINLHPSCTAAANRHALGPGVGPWRGRVGDEKRWCQSITLGKYSYGPSHTSYKYL